MLTAVLATKLFTPPPRPKIVVRSRLMERMDEGLRPGCKMTLISAPAGFGKSTLVSEWAAGNERPLAWLSLDEGDNDLPRFLGYLIAALQTILPDVGESMLALLQSPQPPPAESILTALLNEIASVPEPFTLVLDDYHVVDSKAVDGALTFLLEHLPPRMHLIVATREDPHLPLARLRACGQLTELRLADLRFTPAEAAEFLNRVMGLNLRAEEVAALETRTEGWIAGLQLAAISMQGHKDASGFIRSFTGSHHFVLDYLVEEVLSQQPESLQTFLLRTSVLDRMCGPLCEAVLADSAARGQETLEALERANLFILPLDNERRWYRYHHLFAELLRQRLGQGGEAAGYHLRASQWYENSGMLLEAFHHAAAANDIERAERLIMGDGMPLHALGAAGTVLDWLDSLPKPILDARPRLWLRSATLMLMAGRMTGVEEKLQAAEKAMQGAGPDEQTRDLTGGIAAIRATLALLRYQPEEARHQALRALEYLHPDSLIFRCRANWALGFACQLQGERAAARQAYGEALTAVQVSGNIYYTILAATSLGQVQESDNQLHEAAGTYRRSLQLLSERGHPNASEEFIGLARICYEWNDLEAAQEYGEQSLQLARQYDRAIDRFIHCEVLLARLKLARGDVTGAAAMLAETGQTVRRNNYVRRVSEVAAAQTLALLRLGDLEAAARVAQAHPIPLSQARVSVAREDPAAALALLEPLRLQAEAKKWPDELLKALVLLAPVWRAQGDKVKALQVLEEALELGEPGGFIRTFVDEGPPMARLLSEAAERGIKPEYTGRLLAAFEAGESRSRADLPGELLSERELEVLRLVAEGCSNQEIGTRLFLALDTVKGHNRRIFEKLQVRSRTEAIARARELGLL